MPTLLGIAEHEKIVLFDESVLGLRDFFEQIYDAESYSDLGSDLLQNAMRPLEYFLYFLQKSNTFTVKEALNEFDNLQNIVNNKQRFLQRRNLKRRIKGAKYNSSLFDNISDKIFRITRVVGSKVYKPQNAGLYHELSDSISWLLSARVPSLTVEEKHKQLYTTAFYVAASQKIPVAIVKKSLQFEQDLDFLVESSQKEGPKVLQSINFQEFPIRLYINLPRRNYELVYTSVNNIRGIEVN